MPKVGVEKEKVTISLPIGMSKKARSLGINISYHAGKAVQAEIELQGNK